MRKSRQSGFGLILLVALIAVAGILTTSTALYFRSAAKDVQTKIDVVRAQYTADAAAMEAIYRWHISNTDDRLRTLASHPGFSALFGNISYRSSQQQSNFVYFDMSAANWVNGTFNGVSYPSTLQGTCPSRRYQAWSMKNINDNSGGNPTVNVTPWWVRVEWTAPAGNTARLVDIRLGGVSIIGDWCGQDWGSGPQGCGSGVVYNGLAGIPYPTIHPGESFSGNNTYLEWNSQAAAAQITSVTITFDFTDLGTAQETVTAPINLWGPGVSQAGGSPPSIRNFVINSQGETDQRGGDIRRASKITVSGSSSTSNTIEVTDWDYGRQYYW